MSAPRAALARQPPLPTKATWLGSGWWPVEHHNGLTFRWATNDSEVTVCPDVNNRTLAMMIEPGPGVRSKPFTLHVIGNQGDKETSLVKPGQYVKVAVNQNAPAETFVLGVPPGSGGQEFRDLTKQVPNIPRMVEAAAPPEEILFYREYNNLSLAELEQAGPAAREAYRKLLAQEYLTPHSRVDITEWQPAAM